MQSVTSNLGNYSGIPPVRKYDFCRPSEHKKSQFHLTPKPSQLLGSVTILT